MLIVMNGLCWSVKNEGQTEGETFSEMEKKGLTLIILVIFVCVCVLFTLFLSII